MADTFNYKISHSRRRSISITITPDAQVIVRAPLMVPDLLVRHFVNRKKEWISKKLDQIRERDGVRVRKYAEGEDFLYLGNSYKFQSGNYKEICFSDSKLNFPEFLMFRKKKELENWYKLQAKKVITNRVIHYSKLMDVRYCSINFSDTKSQWGSCSRDNTLQFCYRLIMAPLLVIDYVVVHELTHILQKNHSAHFWNIVKVHKPAYKQYKKWLKENAQRMII